MRGKRVGCQLSDIGCRLSGMIPLVGYAVGLNVPGWTSTFVVVTTVGGIQLLCVGILGEYVGRMYTTLLGRPTYYVAHDTGAVEDPAGR